MTVGQLLAQDEVAFIMATNGRDQPERRFTARQGRSEPLRRNKENKQAPCHRCNLLRYTLHSDRWSNGSVTVDCEGSTKMEVLGD